MGKILSLIIGLFLVIAMQAQTKTTIAQARAMAVGTVVTVSGIVSNGSELGASIRYFQDETGGIAAYSSTLSGVLRGDSITVTGTLKNYNQLLELDPVSSFTVHSANNELFPAQIVTPSQIGEAYEAEVIQINSVTFANAGATFAGNTNYNFTANGQSGVVRMNNGNPLIGTIVPTSTITLYAICSQYSYSSPTTGYQLLVRDQNDFVASSAISFTTSLSVSNLSQNSFQIAWETDEAGTTEAFYGYTKELELGQIPSSGTGTNHTLLIEDLDPGKIVFVNAFSVLGSDTAFSTIRPFVTVSSSTGDIKVYFNTPVDNTYSTGTDAIYLNHLVDDTLCAYINRAKYTLDMCFYNINLNVFNNVLTALNAAANRGVQVRFISDGGSNNLGIDNLVSSIKRLTSPTGSDYTIMHNKFVIMDANSANPDDPYVWTGSTNLTDDNVNSDANNVVIFQDQSIARVYQLEFEEMWGSSTMTPNASLAKFGKFKADNTPHEMIIGGNRVECYFSPSDNTNAKIINTINSANHNLSIATMLVTRTDLAYPIKDKAEAGIATNVVVNSFGECGDAVPGILQPVLGTHFVEDNVAPNTMHSKYVTVDHNFPASDPMVLTGSHNWSNNGNNSNDENTVILHNATIANLYYQNFAYRFVQNNGQFGELTDPPVANDDTITINKNDQGTVITVLENDNYQAAVTLSVLNTGSHGTAGISFADINTLTYVPDANYVGYDTVSYIIVYAANEDLGDTALVVIHIVDPGTVGEINGLPVAFYPNPSKGNIQMLNAQLIAKISLFNYAGSMVEEITNPKPHMQWNLPAGIYFARLETKNGKTITQKIVIE